MRTKTVIGGVFFVLASVMVLSGVLLYSSPAPAAPSVTWAPDHVFQYLVPGGEKSTTVTLLLDPSYKKKGPLALSLTPSLEPYVSIAESPTENPLQVLTLTFTVPVVSPYDIIDGTLHLRSGTSTVSKPLPITLEVNEYGIPPDPGEEGNATLEGIDSDNDVVRDDIQRYISLTYPGSEKTRAALTELAKNRQQTLLNANNKTLSIEFAHEGLRATECLYHARPDDRRDVETELYAELLNTPERSRAFLVHNGQLGGQVFHKRRIDQYKTSCSFDVDLLEN